MNQVCPVFLRRENTDKQLICNLIVPFAVYNQMEDLLFPWGKVVILLRSG